MRAKRIFAAFAAVAAIVGLALAAYRWQARQAPALCQVCGRMIPEQTAYRLDTTGQSIRACCPACAMHYMLHHLDAARGDWATDFNSRQPIPASRAYFDEGGDVQYCTASIPPVERGPEGVNRRVYDRCLPTLVAFSSRDEAETYRQKHGGRVVTYDEALADLRGQ